MPAVEVVMPDLEQAVMDALQRKIDAALEVADEVGNLVLLTAFGEGVDVSGSPLAPKKPRPKNHPRNNPRATLLGEESGQTHMLAKSRWSVNRVDSNTAEVIYDPPDYFDYVIEARPWLTHDQMNFSVREEVRAMMVKAIVETQ